MNPIEAITVPYQTLSQNESFDVELSNPIQRFEEKIKSVQNALGDKWESSLGDCEFQPQVTMDRLRKIELDGGSRQKILNQFISEVEQDLRGFSQEFIDKTGFTPTEYYGYIQKNGSSISSGNFSLFGTRYVSDELTSAAHEETYSVLNMISKKERGGGVFEAWSTVELLAAQAPVGSLIVMTSPGGKSGIYNAKGEEFIYADSRTYFFIVGEEIDGQDIKRTLSSCDVQSDFDQSEHLILLKQLGQELSQDASANEIVRAVTVITPDVAGRKLEIQDGLRAMKAVRHSSNRYEHIYKDRTFEEVEYQLGSFQNLLHLDSKYRRLMSEFTDTTMYFGFEETINYDKIKQAVALLILEAFMQQKIQEEQGLMHKGGFDDYKVKADIVHTYNAIDSVNPFGNIALIQGAQEDARKSSANCPPPDYNSSVGVGSTMGGGGTLSMLAGRSGFWAKENSGLETGFDCPRCRKHIDGGDACLNPDCGLTKEEWAKETGIQCV